VNHGLREEAIHAPGINGRRIGRQRRRLLVPLATLIVNAWSGPR
jgi:hypothetical protein